MKLEYQAYDPTGRLVSSVLDAANIGEAVDRLRQQDLLVAKIVPVGQAIASVGNRLRLPRSRIGRLRDLALFTRQLHSLVHSGTPLVQGLAALERQIKNQQWQQVIADVRGRIEGGSTLADAMAAHPACFDAIFCSMISAGESSGKLADMLGRLASLTRKRITVLNTIRGAMVYPILLAGVAAIVMAVLLLFVVPKFGDPFETLGAPLPPTTAFLIASSEFLRNYWYAAAAMLVAAVLLVRHLLFSDATRQFRDSLVVRLPVFGPMIKSFATARIARLIGQLTDSHLPIQDVLTLTRNTISNSQYAALLEKAQEAVAHGQEMSTVFAQTTLVNPAFCEVLRSGEQSGRVDLMLLELADFLDDENEITLRSLTSIIEPILLVLMAIVVGFVAVSIFLPLFDVTGMVSGGQ